MQKGEREQGCAAVPVSIGISCLTHFTLQTNNLLAVVGFADEVV